MTNTMRCAIAATLLAASAGAARAGDFGLDYEVERVPAARLSVAQCAATIKRAAEAAGSVTRAQDVQGKLAVHVSGPGGGRSLVTYCIHAGALTVWVVQALDYAGPGSSASARL
jgi:hypothetical protein